MQGSSHIAYIHFIIEYQMYFFKIKQGSDNIAYYIYLLLPRPNIEQIRLEQILIIKKLQNWLWPHRPQVQAYSFRGIYRKQHIFFRHALITLWPTIAFIPYKHPLWPSKSFDKNHHWMFEGNIKNSLNNWDLDPLGTILEGDYLEVMWEAFEPQVSNNKSLDVK